MEIKEIFDIIREHLFVPPSGLFARLALGDFLLFLLYNKNIRVYELNFMHPNIYYRTRANTEAPRSARKEIRNLLNDYEIYKSRMDELMEEIEELLSEIPYIDKLMGICGIGIKTVSCFIAEVGDIERFDNPKQVQKLAGYAIVADSSGKHNGESRISHRGRKRLRYALYEAAISVIGKNKEFKEIHHYYRTREKNPLKKMQSVIAVSCKLNRIFYTILTKGIDYDGQKMLRDIVRPGMQSAA